MLVKTHYLVVPSSSNVVIQSNPISDNYAFNIHSIPTTPPPLSLFLSYRSQPFFHSFGGYSCSSFLSKSHLLSETWNQQYHSRVMGRDFDRIRADKKLNTVTMKSNGVAHGSNHHSPKPSGGSVNIRKSKGGEGSQVETSLEKKETVGLKITNQETVSSMGKTPKPEPSKSSEKLIRSPVSPASGPASREANDNAGLHISSNTSSFRSPISTKQSQQGYPFSGLRAPQSYSNKYHDDDDNWSLASSAVTSCTVRSRVTVGVAPSFRSAQRAAQRKEFYTKLEQKHQALKAEKMEYEARTKEEQEEAIKQLRKSMVIKANPVPSFYRQGPPPKVELKKLPVTRAKSPNITRRKSCGDTTHSTIDEKALCSRVRHSLGSYKPGSATSSPVKQSQGRNIMKPKDRTTKQANEGPKGSPLKLSKETNPNIIV
ncbi:hypothetical protein QVD17_05240 [Tagetes erecta]|uniref:TPX2 C-terminal domain-containing protein n=1 Tax=Tagetes erecta TaxID=13708 RepID=A0AAD8LJC4_TARER|nr:hypothetical protein QVD17_05240 [Tagetes erecta]